MPKFSTPPYEPLPPDVDFYYPRELAAYLRCSLQTIYNLIDDHTLPAHWVRGTYRVRREDFASWYAQTFLVGATPCGRPGEGQARGPAPTRHDPIRTIEPKQPNLPF